jgi:hypothetical protein
MLDRDARRRHGPAASQAQSALRNRSTNPVLALQRSIGNRAVAQVLARSPVRTGSVHISGVGDIKVKGGNLDDWTGTESYDTVEVTSQKGRHSRKLEQLANASTRTDVKVTIAPANQAGEQLSVGGGTLLEIKGAHIKDYAVANGVETWRVGDFQEVHRTKVVHRIA